MPKATQINNNTIQILIKPAKQSKPIKKQDKVKWNRNGLKVGDFYSCH